VADFFPWLAGHVISFANGGSLSFSFETATEVDSRKVFFEVLMSRMLDVSEKFSGLLILFTDVTERKLVERQLAQSQKLESIGQLAAGIAHEINTPTQYVNDNIRFIKESFDELSGVMRMCHRFQAAVKGGEPTEELLNELSQQLESVDTEYLVEEIPVAIDQCLEGLARVSDIVRSMKEFARPGLDVKSLIDINRAIESTVVVARNEWKYVAEVILDLAPDLPLVPCMAGEFNQVILNMIINAVHAIKDVIHDETEKGVIRIHTSQRSNDLEITITDTGAGIPAEIAERVFDPFFTTREPGKGMGQGLAMAYRVIKENHGGTITFTSKKNQGTTFVIHLPLR
jgi:signal transduction histidine kinase